MMNCFSAVTPVQTRFPQRIPQVSWLRWLLVSAHFRNASVNRWGTLTTRRLPEDEAKCDEQDAGLLALSTDGAPVAGVEVVGTPESEMCEGS